MRISIALVVVAGVVSLSGAASAQTLSCPHSVESDLTSSGQPQSYDFRYVSFFDGDPSGLANLAPDEGPNPKVLDQRWDLQRTPGHSINMVCRYHGTEKTVVMEVPVEVTQCKLTGLVSEQGEIVGSPSLECN